MKLFARKPTGKKIRKKKKEKMSNIINLFFQKRKKSSPGAVQKSHFIQPFLILLDVFSSIKNYPVLQSRFKLLWLEVWHVQDEIVETWGLNT